MRYIIEPYGKEFTIAVYAPAETEGGHIAVTVQHPLAADVTVGMLNASFAAGKAGRSLDADVVADAMAYLLAPWGNAVSDRGLRAEITAAHAAGLATRDATTTKNPEDEVA